MICNPIWFTIVGILSFNDPSLALGLPEQREDVSNGTRVLHDLQYVNGGHERQKLDLYLPLDARQPLPIILWIHGGGWKNGSKDNCPVTGFVAKGYAVASIGYRLSHHAPFPAQIEDCKAAVRWLRAHATTYHLDPKHIGVWGVSEGGHLAALLGTSGGVKELEGSGGNADQSSRVQAVVDWFGPTDLLQMGGTHNAADAPEAKLLGGSVPDNQQKAVRASPAHYVSKDSPPFLIMHGDKDPLVPFHQSEILADALRKAGVEVTLVRIAGARHGGPGFTTPRSRKQVEEFFDKYLKNAK